MANVLIVYGSNGGHTRRVAARIAEFVSEYGHAATVIDAAGRAALMPRGRYGAAVVVAPVRRGRHPEAVERFVRENLRTLEHLPTAFFSVSLSAAGKEPRQRRNARRCADAFVKETGWRPGMVRLVAGELAYTRYPFFTRQLMRLAAWREGGDTDASRDHEHTDWERLRKDVDTFVTRAVPAPVPVEARYAVLAGV